MTIIKIVKPTIMKKSIKNLEVKEIKNSKAVKGGESTPRRLRNRYQVSTTRTA